MATTSSRLSQMQARFQQRQLLQKEERLTQLQPQDQQQQHSAGSSTSSGGGGGRVRQMFDERRVQRPGVDRSYPLEPIPPNRRAVNLTDMKASKTVSINRGTSLDRNNKTTSNAINVKISATNSVTATAQQRSKTQARTSNNGNAYINNNIEETYSQKSLVQQSTYQQQQSYSQYDNENENDNVMYLLKKQQLELMEQMMNNQNLEDSIEDEDFPDIALIEDAESLVKPPFGKLPNVVRVLPSEIKTEKPRERVSVRQDSVPVTISKRGLSNEKHEALKTTPLKEVTKRKPVVKSVEEKAKGRSYNEPSVVKRNTVRKSVTSSPSSETSSAKKISQSPGVSKSTVPTTKRSTPPVSSPVRSKPSSAKMSRAATSKSAPSTGQTRQGSAPSNAVANDNLVPCKNCGRRFAEDRLAVHQNICAQTSQKKRKPYDPMKHRVQGTEAEQYVKKSLRNKAPPPPALKKNNWRQKHEDFINAIRSAKEAQQHLAAGGKLSDLPPPPPSLNPDYVQCPHCGRRFNEQAASRHIPKCANFMFNKPVPKKMPVKKR